MRLEDEVSDQVVEVGCSVADRFDLAALQFGQDESVAYVYAELVAAATSAGVRCEASSKSPGPAATFRSLDCVASCAPALAAHTDVDELSASPHRVNTCCDTRNVRHWPVSERVGRPGPQPV